MGPGTTEHRTKIDFALFIRDLCDGPYRFADRIVVVMDNLNTHSLASLYEAFPPAEARRIAEKLEIHYTPKHGSWLDIAEIELSVLSRQCLDQRIDSLSKLKEILASWEARHNAEARLCLKRVFSFSRSPEGASPYQPRATPWVREK